MLSSDRYAPWNFRRGVATSRALVATGRSYGLSESLLLSGTKLRPGDLQIPGLEIDGFQELQVARNLAGAMGSHTGLGVQAARQFSYASLGSLGLAFLSAQSIRQAIQLGISSLNLTFAFVKPLYADDGDRAVVYFDDANIPADVRPLFVSRDVTTFCRAWEVLAGRPDGLDVSVRVDADEIKALRAALPNFAITAGAQTVLTIDRELLDARPSQSDPDSFRELELQVADQLRRRALPQRFSGFVQDRIAAAVADPPSMDALADDLHIDVRTLRRHLASEGTSYRSLMDAARSTLAATLIVDDCLTLEAAASRLGYHDAAALSKAFTRWYGVPPGQFRSTNRAPSS
ncbi:helix-turn-helix domain-containing protein [Mycobacterium sp. NPDC051198]